jgi:hypothetical protein
MLDRLSCIIVQTLPPAIDLEVGFSMRDALGGLVPAVTEYVRRILCIGTLYLEYATMKSNLFS